MHTVAVCIWGEALVSHTVRARCIAPLTVQLLELVEAVVGLQALPDGVRVVVCGDLLAEDDGKVIQDETLLPRAVRELPSLRAPLHGDALDLLEAVGATGATWKQRHSA